MKRSYIKRGTSQLKRTPLKRGKTALKRTRLRRVSKASLPTLQRKIWALTRLVVLEKHGNTCYTCDKEDLVGRNLHVGHMWAKASLGAYLKYDTRVLRPQCFNCNINKGGMGADFYYRMWQEIGFRALEALKEDRNITVNARDHYTQLLAELEK